MIKNKTIITVQRIFLLIFLLAINTLFAFKTIEYSIPSNPKMEIFDFGRFGEYYTQLCFAFVIVIVLILFLFKDYKKSFMIF